MKRIQTPARGMTLSHKPLVLILGAAFTTAALAEQAAAPGTGNSPSVIYLPSSQPVAMSVTDTPVAAAPEVKKGVPGKPAGSKPQSQPFTPGATPQQAAAPESSMPSEIGPAMSLVVGKSTLIRLADPIERISVGNPAIADVTMINSRELYLLGKTFGSTNVMMWRKGGPTTIIDVAVSADASALLQRLRTLLPEEKGIKVEAAADSLVLAGVVTSAVKAEYAMQIAEGFIRAYTRGMTLPVTAGNPVAAQGQTITVGQATASAVGGALQTAPRVVNLMRVMQPQQVMLEVKVAEISKTLLDKLGGGLNLTGSSGSWRYGIVSDLLSNGGGGIFGLKSNGNSINVDAERKDGLVKVLAEPNIVAISGQEASFLAGGKVFIPVARNNQATGLATITLEEKEFGVGLKFTPTVLDGGRINLKVAPEVSELAQAGSPFTTVGGITAILPSFTTRRAQTTVQLGDGQSFAIAGLIKNNVTETVRKLPVLGEIPVLGALFRSSEFQGDRSELMFIITPRLVKPLGPDYALPTDAYTPPSRTEFFVNGQLEGSGSSDVPPDRPAPDNDAAAPRGTSTGGFQVN